MLIVVDEVAPEQMEHLKQLGIEVLKTIHEISREITQAEDLDLSEAIRMEHEILMTFVAALMRLHIQTVNKTIEELNRQLERDVIQYEVM